MRTHWSFVHHWLSKQTPKAAALLAIASTLPVVAVDLQATFNEDTRNTPRLVIPAPGEAIVGNSQAGAETFLKIRAAEFKLPADLSNLQLVKARESLLGTHYRYRQVLNGIPVEGAEVIVSISPKGEVYQSFNNTYPVTAAPPVPKQAIAADKALDLAWEHLRVHGKLKHAPRADLVYLPENGSFRLAYKTFVPVEAPDGEWEHRIDALSGEILSARDTRIKKIKDTSKPKFGEYPGIVWSREQTTRECEAEQEQALAAKAAIQINKTTVDGSGRVFDADPRTYLNNAGLVDASAASAFNAAYVTRTLRDITEFNGVYTLDGPYVTIQNFEAPNTAPSSTSNGQWIFSRGNNAFNDAMTYFHIDKNQRYLQFLGFVGAKAIQNRPITTDSDGVNGDDNSYYSPGLNQLSFGHGGVDDNEDADVILHEYGHAITFDILGGWAGGDTGAIGEGFGDYWGGSYSSTTVNGKTFRPEWAFSWDGHSADTWPGRFLNMTNLTYDHTRYYDAHEPIGGVDNYSDQLWSAPLWAAFIALTGSGYDRTNIDKIVIESFFGVGTSPKMRDLAYSTVSAANQLFPSGPYGTVFNEKFLAQNIIPPPPMPSPAFIVPAGGETFGTGSVLQISWNRQGAPAAAATRIEYSTGVTTSFSDSMENGVNGWVVSRTGGSLNWAQTTSASHSPTRSWFATDQVTVTDQYLRSPQISVAAGAVLSFWHWYDLEPDFDGGVVEVSLNGTTWTDLGSLATQNGYTATISYGYGSTIAGRMAFTGGSGGWIQTLIPLNTYAGQNIYIRFRASSDSSEAAVGWYVDDVSVSKEWTTIGTAPAGASTYAWNTPLVVGNNYKLRIQQFASGYTDSAWVQSAVFSLANRPPPPPRPTVSIGFVGNSVRISFPTVSGWTYKVQYKNSFADETWSDLSDVPGTGGTVNYNDPLTSRRFYRVFVP